MKNIKRIAVVTGGAGFIGSHMVDLLLRKNYKVKVIDNLSGGRLENIKKHFKNKNFYFQKKDICKIEPEHKFFKSCDYVFHFAGIGDIVPSIENPIKYLKTNVIGTANVLKAAKKASVKKFIYSASSSCYGLEKVPTSEKDKINPLYPYAMSKYMGEKLCFHWHKLYKLPVISIRIFNAYGPRVKTTGVYGAVFGVFFKQKLENKPYTIVGNGNQKRDFTYVTDVVDVFIKCIKYKKNCQIFNVGSGQAHSVNKICSLLGGEKQSIPLRPGEPRITFADIKKISRELKWKPKIKIEQGVNLVLKNINYWDKAPLWTKKRIKIATKDWFKYLKD